MWYIYHRPNKLNLQIEEPSTTSHLLQVGSLLSQPELTRPPFTKNIGLQWMINSWYQLWWINWWETLRINAIKYGLIGVMIVSIVAGVPLFIMPSIIDAVEKQQTIAKLNQSTEMDILYIRTTSELLKVLFNDSPLLLGVILCIAVEILLIWGAARMSSRSWSFVSSFPLAALFFSSSSPRVSELVSLILLGWPVWYWHRIFRPEYAVHCQYKL